MIHEINVQLRTSGYSTKCHGSSGTTVENYGGDVFFRQTPFACSRVSRAGVCQSPGCRRMITVEHLLFALLSPLLPCRGIPLRAIDRSIAEDPAMKPNDGFSRMVVGARTSSNLMSQLYIRIIVRSSRKQLCFRRQASYDGIR